MNSNHYFHWELIATQGFVIDRSVFEIEFIDNKISLYNQNYYYNNNNNLKEIDLLRNTKNISIDNKEKEL